jgi:hypothetical protein
LQIGAPVRFFLLTLWTAVAAPLCAVRSSRARDAARATTTAAAFAAFAFAAAAFAVRAAARV